MKRKKSSKFLALVSAFVLGLGSNATMIQAEEPITFNYTGGVQEVTLEPGSYLFEAYGAQGGNARFNGGVIANTNAMGGYSKGMIDITETSTFYIYVGGKGGDGASTARSQALGGWNGGGNGGRDRDDDGAGGGGGASDIRLVGGAWNNAESLNSRIFIASGGSGAASNGNGRPGGKIDGLGNVLNATQTTGYAFGYGTVGTDYLSGDGVPSSGGGGGYYGGSTSPQTSSGAGSSFISGHAGCDAILLDRTHSGQPIHYSGLFFTNTETQYGIQSGNGLVRITSQFPDLAVLLDIGEVAQLSVTHQLPDNTTLTWTSTNQNVVTVDGNGVVTAIEEGISFIWAENADGTYRESIPIRVIEGAEDMRLSLHLNAGESKRLWFGYDPLAVNWQSMDESVTTIDYNGQVTAIKQGLCIIRAELDGTEKYIYVRVNDIIE